MKKQDLYDQLTEKILKCWDDYEDSLLKLTPSVLIHRADEIAAASFCCGQLTSGISSYSGDLLEHLLHYENPLEVIREQWMLEQTVDPSEEFEHALWSLREYGPEPETDGPVMGGMT